MRRTAYSVLRPYISQESCLNTICFTGPTRHLADHVVATSSGVSNDTISARSSTDV